MKTISASEYQSQRDTYGGYCTKCEEFTHDSAEPDAENYRCPECGENTVVGAENALIMGLLDISDTNYEPGLGPSLDSTKKALISGHRTFFCPISGECFDFSRVHIIQTLDGRGTDIISHTGWDMLKPETRAKLKIVTSVDEL